MSTLGRIFSGGLNLLDLPGSSVRDLAVGDPAFDQWLTPFSEQNRATAGDVLRRPNPFGVLQLPGMIGPEDTWANLPARLAVGIGTDPLNLIPAGAGAWALRKVLGGAGKAAKVAKSATPAAKLGIEAVEAALPGAKLATEAAETAIPGMQRTWFHASPNEITEPFRMTPGRAFGEPAGAFFASDADEALRATGRMEHPELKVSEWNVAPTKTLDVANTADDELYRRLYAEAVDEAEQQLRGQGIAGIERESIPQMAGYAGLGESHPARLLSQKLRAQGYDAVQQPYPGATGKSDLIALDPSIISRVETAIPGAAAIERLRQAAAIGQPGHAARASELLSAIEQSPDLANVMGHVPESVEFLGAGREAAAYKTPLGDVLRISRGQVPQPPALPGVLQPTMHTPYNDFTVSRVPHADIMGLETPFTEAQQAQRGIEETLRTAGYSPKDVGGLGNIGMHQGQPVLVDYGAIGQETQIPGMKAATQAPQELIVPGVAKKRSIGEIAREMWDSPDGIQSNPDGSYIKKSGRHVEFGESGGQSVIASLKTDNSVVMATQMHPQDVSSYAEKTAEIIRAFADAGGDVRYGAFPAGAGWKQVVAELQDKHGLIVKANSPVKDLVVRGDVLLPGQGQ
jgi:hypothetical protein